MTEKTRWNVTVPPELEEKVFALRKTDEYCRMTISEILRILIAKGLAAESGDPALTQPTA